MIWILAAISGFSTALSTRSIILRHFPHLRLGHNILTSFFSHEKGTRLSIAAIALSIVLIGVAVWMMLRKPAISNEEIVPQQPQAIKEENVSRPQEEISKQAPQSGTKVGISSKPLQPEKPKILPYEDRQRGIRPRTTN